MKPLIGITCFQSKIELGEIKDSLQSVQGSFVEIIEKAGGLPVIIPMLDEENVHEYLNMVDGILLTGGDDVDPSMYNQERKEYCGTSNLVRDKQEKYIVEYCLLHRKPILAICRGIQMMNVALGGTLYQDVYQELQTILQHGKPHTIALSQDSLLYPIFHSDFIQVNSFHHQGIKEVADRLEVKGIAEDGMVEYVEIMGHPFAVGIQWHPEFMLEDYNQQRIFQLFTEICAKKGVYIYKG